MRPSRATTVLAVLCTVACTTTVVAQRGASTAAAGMALVKKYANSDLGSLLLKEPKVRSDLARLLGPELNHLRANLDVSGPVDVVGGALSVSGNAPHKGTEEEAVVCVGSYNLDVHAAILSAGTIRVYTAQKEYEFLPQCIKDWITLANSSHQDRLTRPKNVELVVHK